MAAFARSGDFWSGLALAALGAWIVSEARGWTYMGEDGPGAGFFPVWYGSLMVVLALALVVSAVLRAPRTAPQERTSWRDLGRAMACWLAFVACIAMMKVVGFAIALASLTWFIIAVMARQPQRIALTVAIVGSVGFYVLFEYGLDLSLPRGILF